MSFGSMGKGEGEFHFPRSVAVTSQGHFVVADTDNNRVQVFDASGAFLRCLAQGRVQTPVSVCLWGLHNQIMVACWSSNSVCVLDFHSGEIMCCFRVLGVNCVAVTADGGLVVSSSHKVQMLSVTCE